MRGPRLDHPVVVRLCHWSGALAVAVLIPSGLEIFRAFPSFGEKIPQVDVFVPPAAVTLGGWLGGALQWHFAFAWIFVASGVAYLTYQIASGNIWQVLFTPRDLPGVWPMVRHYVFFGPRPAQRATYNPLQKLAYTSVIGLGVAAAVTGAALYKPVQLSWLVTLLGGFRLTRVWHFATMCGLLAFIPGHLVMVALHGWPNFASMWTGAHPSAGGRGFTRMIHGFHGYRARPASVGARSPVLSADPAAACDHTQRRDGILRMFGMPHGDPRTAARRPAVHGPSQILDDRPVTCAAFRPIGKKR